MSNRRIKEEADESVLLDHLQENPNGVEPEEEVIYHEKKHRKPVLIGTIFTIVLAVGISLLSGTSSPSGEQDQIVSNRVSTTTQAGETMYKSEKSAGIEAKNFTVNLSDSGGTARMLIWDFNQEDLDKVSIYANGEPIKEQFTITNEPAAISIPVPSTITIVGYRDTGGGGISYAVKFPNNKQTYFNFVYESESNSYVVHIR